MKKWSFIEDLNEDSKSLADPTLQQYTLVWKEREAELREDAAYAEFINRMRREWAIETGILERLYNIDDEATKTLIEKGLDAALLTGPDTDRSPELTMAIVQDQYQAIEGIYQFVSAQRPLTAGYVRELHQIITRNQASCVAVDPQGTQIEVPLIRGAWKTLPNNIEFSGGGGIEFCPPEHVESEMAKLIKLHYDHVERGVPVEVQCAWLHHRFTQIHPFQDGNGRIARCLATLVLLKAGWFPLVVNRRDRGDYIGALRRADDGDLEELVVVISRLQRKAIREALSLSESVEKSRIASADIFASIRGTLTGRKKELQENQKRIFQTGDALQLLLEAQVNEAAEKLTSALKSGSEKYWAVSSGAMRGTEEEGYNRIQVVDCAKQLGYFANMPLFHSWQKLQIRAAGLAEILFSIHGVGRLSPGVLVCTSMFYHRVKDEEGGGSRVEQVWPLTSEPFEFTYLEEPSEVTTRFSEWVENCLLEGLKRWQDDL